MQTPIRYKMMEYYYLFLLSYIYRILWFGIYFISYSNLDSLESARFVVTDSGEICSDIGKVTLRKLDDCVRAAVEFEMEYKCTKTYTNNQELKPSITSSNQRPETQIDH